MAKNHDLTHMNIVFDVRALLEKNTTGVGVYTKELLEHLLKIDTENTYVLFYNAYKRVPHLEAYVKKIRQKHKNVEIVHTKWPNKILNLVLSWTKLGTIESMIEKKIDLFFMPDIRPVRLKNGKLITVVHDLSFERYRSFFSLKTKWWHRIIQPKKIIARADKIIAVSHFTKNELSELYGTSPSKITVIHEGPGRIKKGLPRHPGNYFLAVGTIEPRKNTQNMIAGFHLFKKQYPEHENMKLVLVGQKHHGAFKSVVREHANDIEWTGYLDEKEKRKRYANAHALVYPSVYEGFGLPVLEAWQQGIPVLASDIPVIGEVAENAALRFNPHDPEAIAEAFAIIMDKKTRSEYAERGKKRVKDFSWEIAAKKTLQLMRSAVKG